MLLRLNPANATIQLFGGALLIYGVWAHAATTIMGAIPVIRFGHLWGWEKVHDAP